MDGGGDKVGRVFCEGGDEPCSHRASFSYTKCPQSEKPIGSKRRQLRSSLIDHDTDSKSGPSANARPMRMPSTASGSGRPSTRQMAVIGRRLWGRRGDRHGWSHSPEPRLAAAYRRAQGGDLPAGTPATGRWLPATIANRDRLGRDRGTGARRRSLVADVPRLIRRYACGRADGDS